MGRPECPGLTWLAVDEIFSRIRDQMLDTEFLIRMSYIEIYNEEIKVGTHPTTSTAPLSAPRIARSGY